MQTIHVKQIYRLAFLALALLLAACVSPRQLAADFVVGETDLHVLVLPPPELIKSYAPGHPDDLPADSIHGPGDERARFVNEVEDSLFVEEFMGTLRRYLDILYVDHYGPDELDAFFELEEQAYIFAAGQMELLEYVDEERFEGRTAADTYRARVEITVVESNVWFEFLKLHDPDHDMEVLFDVQSVADYVDGRFVRRRDGTVRFEPDKYLLTMDDIYDLAARSGKRNAQNIFDHIMNLRVREQMDREPDIYFHYDVDEHSLKERDYPPFIRIEPEANDIDQSE